VLAAGLIAFLSVTEYRPADREAQEITGTPGRTLAAGDTITLLTWNLGYGALGDNADFFMDGGTGVKTADTTRVRGNMDRIFAAVEQLTPDVVLFQEIDVDSTRSSHIDELALARERLGGYASSFANNFKVAFLPYPIPPIGKVDSGVPHLRRFPLFGRSACSFPSRFLACPYGEPEAVRADLPSARGGQRPGAGAVQSAPGGI
jgi:hypothetical protein